MGAHLKGRLPSKVRTRLGRSKRALALGCRAAARKVPGHRAAARRFDHLAYRHLVKASGLFDREWYGEAVSLAFADTDEAVRHYLYQARGFGPSPCLLIEPEWFDRRQSQPRAGRARAMGGLLRYLVRGSEGASVHPWFDETAWLELHPEAAAHPGRALGHFLATASSSTPMPGCPNLLWGEAEGLLREAQHEWARQRDLEAPRFRPTWDGARERAFRSGIEGVSLPEPLPGVALVSIVMPVRNRPKLVVEAIQSVLQQDMPHFELIVVDDGSTDETAEVVERIADSDPRVRLVRGFGEGVCAARNAGIQHATAEWLAFLDSDNTWNPDHLGSALRGLISRDARVGYSAVEFRSEDGSRYLDFEGTLSHLSMANYVDMNTLVVRTELALSIGGFSRDLRRMVDWDLVLRLAEIEMPVYLPFVGAVYNEGSYLDDRISVTEPLTWGDVVRNRHLIDWECLEATPRDPSLTSILVPALGDWPTTVRVVRSALDTGTGLPEGHEIELVVQATGGGRDTWVMLNVLLGTDPRVRLFRGPSRRGAALTCNLALSASRGATVVFLSREIELRPGWLAPQVEDLRDPDVLGVQPVLTDRDGIIQCAGTVFPGGNGLPAPFLEGHPLSTAQGIGPIPVRAVSGAVLAMRAADVLALRGFDPLLAKGTEDVDPCAVDLCLRAGKRRRTGRFLVDTAVEAVGVGLAHGTDGDTPRALFMARWAGQLPPRDEEVVARAGFRIAHYDVVPTSAGRLSAGRPMLVRDPRVVLAGPAVGKPSLRWSIVTSAPAGPAGRVWGDVHFAEGLAAALGRLGQDVVVDAREQAHRASGSIDDVRVTLQGLDEPVVRPGRVNMLWVISHPDRVKMAHLLEHDVVFAASETWAARMTRISGRPVIALLQATDPARFNPDRAMPDTGPDVLFIGNSRKIYRPIVRDALEAGLDLKVIGTRWEPFIPSSVITGQNVPNELVGAMYRSAGVVLNDHWDDMREHGFISTRIFDAVASGARVVSDSVVGLESVFGDAVRVYETPEDLARLWSERDTAFPDDEARCAHAARMAREHSFDVRAAALLDAALEARAQQLSGSPGL